MDYHKWTQRMLGDGLTWEEIAYQIRQYDLKIERNQLRLKKIQKIRYRNK